VVTEYSLEAQAPGAHSLGRKPQVQLCGPSSQPQRGDRFIAWRRKPQVLIAWAASLRCTEWAETQWSPIRLTIAGLRAVVAPATGCGKRIVRVFRVVKCAYDIS
jgi:hypothetical protein